MKLQPSSDSPSSPFASWNRFLPSRVSDRFVCMPLPLTPVTGFGRNDAVMSSCCGHLAADELVELHLVRRDARLGVGVVHLELRRRHLGVVLLVAEAQGALRLGRVVDEPPQRVARQRVVVAARRDELERPGQVVLTLGVAALEEEALDLVRGVGDRAVLREEAVGQPFQPAAHVGGVRRAVALLHLAEHQHLPGPEDVRRQPVERRPVDHEAQVRFRLLREPPDGRPVERQVVGRLQQELLVVVEHVEAALEVRETHRDGLDALLVREVLHPLLADLVGRHAVQPLLLGGEVHLLQPVVGNLQEIAQRNMVVHGHPPFPRLQCAQERTTLPQNIVN